MKKYNLKRLKHECEFGNYTYKENPYTGINYSEFKPLFKKRFGYVTTNITLQVLVTGSRETDTITIAIKHDPRVKQSLAVMIDNVEYRIIEFNVDDDINAYDVLTLKKVKGH